MIKCSTGSLSSATTRFLAARQTKVNGKHLKSEKYGEAKRLFALKANNAFREIRDLLDKASPTADACVYCERDRRREVEHVRPQRHYPEAAFEWTNYVLSCTICNQDLKNDRSAVIDAHGNLIEFDRFSLAPDDPPPAGIHALINPRIDDPLEFFQLDLDTGELVICATTTVNKLRAQFTRDLFDLNNDTFLRIRRGARMSLLAYAKTYRDCIRAGNVIEAGNALFEIKEHPNPTVLAELKRQGKLVGLPL